METADVLLEMQGVDEKLDELLLKYDQLVAAVNVIAPAVNWLTENTKALFEIAATLQQGGGMAAIQGMMGGQANG